jgi:hypothetical protein
MTWGGALMISFPSGHGKEFAKYVCARCRVETSGSIRSLERIYAGADGASPAEPITAGVATAASVA